MTPTLGTGQMSLQWPPSAQVRATVLTLESPLGQPGHSQLFWCSQQGQAGKSRMCLVKQKVSYTLFVKKQICALELQVAGSFPPGYSLVQESLRHRVHGNVTVSCSAVPEGLPRRSQGWWGLFAAGFINSQLEQHIIVCFHCENTCSGQLLQLQPPLSLQQCRNQISFCQGNPSSSFAQSSVQLLQATARS